MTADHEHTADDYADAYAPPGDYRPDYYRPGSIKQHLHSGQVAVRVHDADPQRRWIVTVPGTADVYATCIHEVWDWADVWTIAG